MSPRATARLRRALGAVFALVAVVSWWLVVEDGPSTAKVITAVAATVAAVIQFVGLVRGPSVHGGSSGRQPD